MEEDSRQKKASITPAPRAGREEVRRCLISYEVK
jgi:hypothetical protein